MILDGFLLLLFVVIATSQIDGFSAVASNVHTLLLCRHGDSIWNGGQEGQFETFTGWTDVPLSEKGEEEAKEAARQLSSYIYDIDVCFTSTLGRAQVTAQECLRTLAQQGKRPKVDIDYRLNERHYGDLQSLVKQDVEDGKYGHDPVLVQQWRRSWHVRPPQMKENDPRRLAEFRIHGQHVPNGESLEMVAKNRVRPFLDQKLTPLLEKMAAKRGRDHATGAVVAHANSLRALIGIICEVEENFEALQVLESLRIPTGKPLALRFQRLPNGRYQACPLPASEECLITEFHGGIGHPQEAPTALGHPSLRLWPLHTCIPMESYETEQAPVKARERIRARLRYR